MSLGHYRVPEHIKIKFDPILHDFSQELVTSSVVPTILHEDKAKLHQTSDELATDSLSVTMSMALLVLGTILFSSLIASIVAVIVTKKTSSTGHVVCLMNKILLISCY